ncbi:P27 family phage terminase small subunit [Aeromonas salmonicida]|uniref:P27 family phage terminase small subunit n=1 Tax=Aeromonas salmonicida TaxID=645 RepID=UPI003D310073
MTVIKMNAAATAIYKKTLSTLKKERDIKKSDLDSIALLAINIDRLEKANAAIDEHGFMIESTTEKGTTIKQNPACINADLCQSKIIKLMDSLLMSPKAKLASIRVDAEKEPEEKDALDIALGKIGSK